MEGPRGGPRPATLRGGQPQGLELHERVDEIVQVDQDAASLPGEAAKPGSVLTGALFRAEKRDEMFDQPMESLAAKGRLRDLTFHRWPDSPAWAEKMRYRVIGLNLDPNPSVRYEPVAYPESEIYHFEPLDEHVPVYQHPFMLLQEVLVEASNEAQAEFAKLDALTLTGTFDYQACDDEICYNPESIPLSFTLDLADRD